MTDCRPVSLISTQTVGALSGEVGRTLIKDGSAQKLSRPTAAVVSRGNVVLFFGGGNHARTRELPGGAEGIRTDGHRTMPSDPNRWRNTAHSRQTLPSPFAPKPIRAANLAPSASTVRRSVSFALHGHEPLPRCSAHAGHTVHRRSRALARERRMVLPTPEAAIHVVADGEAGVLRGDDPAHCSGPHHLADADRRDVGAALVHPAPHRWVERDVKDFDQELAIAGSGTGSSVRLQSLHLGRPTGLAASRN